MASPPPSEKRCLYEVLGLRLDCTPDEIRSAYKKLALQRHPDKLVQSGLSSAAATASFQELVNAYEVLSDPRERSWYDSHRSQILFSNNSSSSSSNSSKSSSYVPDLFSFFSNSVFSGFTDSKKGFYKVYGDVFDKIYSNELNFARKLGLGLDAVKEAPVMGNLESPYEQATAFYGYWLGFATVMDFCWVDQYDAMAGANRKSRRVMEEENKKLRKKARKEYNETVRGLAEFAKKRDKRVIDMQVKRNEEMERKREEERERKRVAEREKMERARAYREPEWAKVEEEDGEVVEDGNEGEEEDEKMKKDGKELYCVVCGKKFKSEKQWKNHEQSKKHKEKVAELKEAFGDEERGEEERQEGFDGNVDDGVDELSDRFESSFGFPKQNGDHDDAQSSEEEGNEDVGNNGEAKGMSFGEDHDDDDEASVLEAMLSGHKSKKNVSSVHKPKAKASSTKDGGRSDDDEMDFREYNNTKGARRKRGAKGERGRRYDDEAATADRTENIDQVAENNGLDDSLQKDGILFPSSVENESNDKGDDLLEKGRKVSKQPVDRKDNAKKDANAKSKNSSKGRKQKATSKASATVCDTCGEDFESRNRLHKHLGDTGHASLKSR
ncbi:hypothetical protein RHMOL_Rhmol08G0198400 [Rhododendron molle]|uniref:Uncharacterized protein n=1 Tax=Rhododendron molle TaxID=49168 RepID=A0ACC0MRK3_RHOML|nr:hypothetical protein RHMOL_Rhmol08G0198400 [Rhododendron molle]